MLEIVVLHADKHCVNETPKLPQLRLAEVGRTLVGFENCLRHVRFACAPAALIEAVRPSERDGSLLVLLSLLHLLAYLAQLKVEEDQ